MPTQLLSPGLTVNFVQNNIYALPSKRCHVTSSAALEYSLDQTTWTAATGANTVGMEVSAGFLRCPGGAAKVRIAC